MLLKAARDNDYRNRVRVMPEKTAFEKAQDERKAIQDRYTQMITECSRAAAREMVAKRDYDDALAYAATQADENMLIMAGRDVPDEIRNMANENLDRRETRGKRKRSEEYYAKRAKAKFETIMTSDMSCSDSDTDVDLKSAVKLTKPMDMSSDDEPIKEKPVTVQAVPSTSQPKSQDFSQPAEEAGKTNTVIHGKAVDYVNKRYSFPVKPLTPVEDDAKSVTFMSSGHNRVVYHRDHVNDDCPLKEYWSKSFYGWVPFVCSSYCCAKLVGWTPASSVEYMLNKRCTLCKKTGTQTIPAVFRGGHETAVYMDQPCIASDCNQAMSIIGTLSSFPPFLPCFRCRKDGGAVVMNNVKRKGMYSSRSFTMKSLIANAKNLMKTGYQHFVANPSAHSH